MWYFVLEQILLSPCDVRLPRLPCGYHTQTGTCRSFSVNNAADKHVSPTKWNVWIEKKFQIELSLCGDSKVMSDP